MDWQMMSRGALMTFPPASHGVYVSDGLTWRLCLLLRVSSDNRRLKNVVFNRPDLPDSAPSHNPLLLQTLPLPQLLTPSGAY